jgi:hypothetical protein
MTSIEKCAFVIAFSVVGMHVARTELLSRTGCILYGWISALAFCLISEYLDFSRGKK